MEGVSTLTGEFYGTEDLCHCLVFLVYHIGVGLQSMVGINVLVLWSMRYEAAMARAIES